MYVCIAHSGDTLKFKDKEVIYRIYDTKTNSCADIDFINVYDILRNNVPINNLRIRRGKIVGDNIDIIRLSYSNSSDRAVIIGYIKDKDGNTIGYDIVWQNGNRDCCSYEQALHMLEFNSIINAAIVNARVRLMCTTGISTRTIDKVEFGHIADKAHKRRKEESDKKRDEYNKESSRRSQIVMESQTNNKSKSRHKSTKQSDSLASSMIKEYSKPGPLQSQRAIMKLFKR